MADKLISSAVTFRDEKGVVEWFLVKNSKDQFELPKTDVRRGESSVSGILRYVKESIGLRPTVLDEVGRTTLTSTKNGEELNEKLFFYLIINKGQDSGSFIEGSWFKFPVAKKKLGLVREQKILAQAHELSKQWTQKKKVKKVK